MSQPEKKPSFISSLIEAIKKIFGTTAPQQPTTNNDALPDITPKIEPVKMLTDHPAWQQQATSPTEAKPETAITPTPRKDSNPTR